MKVDEDVRMISAEAAIVFARACEMFILEFLYGITLKKKKKKKKKKKSKFKNDEVKILLFCLKKIATAITRTEIFDFLVDIVPRGI